MSQLRILDPHDLYHAPHLMAETVVRIEKVIEAAAALERWDDLQKAIDFLIECQQVILQWWRDNVREGGRPSQKPSQDREKLSIREAQERIGLDDSRLSRWRGAHKDLNAYRERVETAARRKAELEAQPNRVSPNTGEQEWFTPLEYIEAAREVMGGIDLDPATHPIAQRTVQAATWFTAEDDGLAREWSGRVWLNPPYDAPFIGQFAAKLVREFMAGNVEQAIMVTNNCTDTRWFHDAQSEVAAMCFTLGRIRFAKLDGSAGDAPLQGQTFFYYGENLGKFLSVFSAFGFVVSPCRP